MRKRSLFAFAALCLGASANATFTYTVLHPTGTFASYGEGINSTSQVGYVLAGGYRASLWTGTAASWVDLNPAGANSSQAFGCDGGNQYGYATVTGLQRASMWSGTAASWVNLTPAGMAPAVVYDSSGGAQAGFVTSGGFKHASMWAGTAGSWVDLHPGGTFANSVATDIAGGIQGGYGTTAQGISHALKWTGTAASAINLTPAGASSSGVSCVSNTGILGGQATFSGLTQGGIWSGTAASWVSLHPAGAQLSRVSDMSGNTQVGDIIVSGSNRACLWKGTAASMVDLHAVLPADFDYSFAKAVVVDGGNTYVFGYGFNTTTDQEEAILWFEGSADNFTFALNKSSVAGQNSVQGTITKSQSSPTATVFTTYDNSSLVTTPATVTVAANTLVKNFQITVTAVTSTINTIIYAKRGTITRSQPLALVPLIPTALSFTPSQVTGGQATSCKVVVNGVAGPSGRVIAILDNSPYSNPPSTVTVPPGGTSVTFNIPTTSVTSQKVVTVTARVSAGEKTGTFRINP